MKVNILGLNKAEVLLALYKNALYDGPYYEFNEKNKNEILNAMKNKISPSMEKAISYIKHTKTFYFYQVDLGQGKKILKIDLILPNTFDPTEYDNFHGIGAAEKAIKALRAEKYTAFQNTLFQKPNNVENKALIEEVNSNAVEKEEQSKYNFKNN